MTLGILGLYRVDIMPSAAFYNDLLAFLSALGVAISSAVTLLVSAFASPCLTPC